jgi:hypothetical protein
MKRLKLRSRFSNPDHKILMVPQGIFLVNFFVMRKMKYNSGCMMRNGLREFLDALNVMLASTEKSISWLHCQ